MGGSLWVVGYPVRCWCGGIAWEHCTISMVRVVHVSHNINNNSTHQELQHRCRSTPPHARAGPAASSTRAARSIAEHRLPPHCPPPFATGDTECARPRSCATKHSGSTLPLAGPTSANGMARGDVVHATRPCPCVHVHVHVRRCCRGASAAADAWGAFHCAFGLRAPTLARGWRGSRRCTGRRHARASCCTPRCDG